MPLYESLFNYNIKKGRNVCLSFITLQTRVLFKNLYVIPMLAIGWSFFLIIPRRLGKPDIFFILNQTKGLANILIIWVNDKEGENIINL